MAKVSYHPEPGAAEETSQFGFNFAKGKSVDVSDAHALAKFRGNRFFKVSEKEKETEDSGLKAVHRGAGSYSIMDGDKEVKQGLTKADADAFNGLSDADKAEYIK